MEGPMKKFSEAKIQLERIYENVDSLLGSTRGKFHFQKCNVSLKTNYVNISTSPLQRLMMFIIIATVSNSILLNANARSMSELIGKFKEEANSTRLRFSKEHMKAVFFGGYIPLCSYIIIINLLYTVY